MEIGRLSDAEAGGRATGAPGGPVLAGGDPGFRALFDDNPVPMWICSRDGLRFLRVNAAAARSYGWPETRFLQWTLDDIRPPDERSPAGEVPSLPAGPCRHVDADGAIRCVEMASGPVVFEGRPALLMTVWDVTDRMRAEQALREAHRLARIGGWRATVPAGGRGTDLALSADLLAMLGLDAAGQPEAGRLHAMMEPGDRRALDGALRRAVARRRAFETEVRFLRPDGRTMHLRIGGQPVPAPDGGVTLDGYCQDVTEHRAAQSALRQADKLSAMGQLTGGVAHDFNNLLTVVAANLELAMAALPEGETRSLLAEASAAVERGAALTGYLLAFARRQALHPAVIALGPFLDGFSRMVARTLGDRHRVLVAPAAAGLAVLCDEGQLETAMLNLVLNARDAMPDGGPIAIEAQPAGRMVVLRVRDRGIGMSPEVRERVLEPFFTTKPPGQGTGLGLSMALGFARQSGGDLTVESVPGHGSTLSLMLPRAEAAAAGAAARGLAGGLPPGIEVLLVEDDPSVRAVALSIFERFGARTTGAATAEEALDLLATGRPCDLLFTDIVLGPGLDGFELGRRVRRDRPSAAVLFTSGYNERAADAAGSPELADCELLPKPYGIEPLRAAVARALHRAAQRPAPADRGSRRATAGAGREHHAD